MTIITQDGYDPGDDPAGVPLIGYDNKITDVTASSEDADFPASNLLNPATHLLWQAEDETAQTISIATSGETNYVALARHNLLDSGASISLLSSANSDAASGYLKLLLHFEGANASTDFLDSSGNDVGFSVSAGSISIGTSQFKFGAASGSFGGGYIFCGSSPTFAFGTNDFTIDCWVRLNATGAVYTIIDSGASTTGFSIRKNASDFLIFRTGNTDRITGATAMTTGTWHHVAVARSGTSTKMFLNGVQQGSTYTDSNSYAGVPLARIGQDQTTAEPWLGFIDEFRVLIGRAAFTAAFTAPTLAYADGNVVLAGNFAALLHFDGTDASTTITDSGGADHVFTAQGNAQLDTAQFKFGTASALFDGTGDYLQGDGSDDFAFADSDFTIDFWVRLNVTGTQVVLYDGRPLGTNGPYVTIYKKATNVLTYLVDSIDQITGATAMTGAVWHHIALTRSGTSTKLFLNGVQEGSTYSDSNSYLNGTSRPAIGIDAALLTSSVNGWIDELRIVKGAALWTTTFAVPQRAAGSQASLGRGIAVDDAAPLIFRFTPTDNLLSLNISAGSDPAQIAVIYAGELLVLERSVKVDVQHANVVHARQSNVLSGMSESGNFLGRVLTSEWRESQADFAWFTPDWYRENFEPFAESAMTDPFFWAWNPDEYPDEVAFAWIIEDVVPETDPATRRVAATITMRAIA